MLDIGDFPCLCVAFGVGIFDYFRARKYITFGFAAP